MQIIQTLLYSLMGAAMAALVGYGLASMSRGKTATIYGAFKAVKAMTGVVTEASSYTYSTTSDGATNIVTGASGN
jgi:hypothetical protein